MRWEAYSPWENNLTKILAIYKLKDIGHEML